ncbi:MAG TPA: S53 family peptidase [Kofleriaceae bacterium]|jgi:subtilase family serine protease|nr:S53 family peptidase [Kofleriaceae bacterium]
MLSKLATLLTLAAVVPACAVDPDAGTGTDSSEDAVEVALQAPDFTAVKFLDHAQVCSAAAGAEVRCHAHVLIDRNGVFATVAPSGFGPADLRSAYNITSTGSASTTIAIVDAMGYPTAEDDLATYRAQFGLPACTTANGCFKKVNQKGVEGNYPAQDVGWSQETALDLDMASAMCPSCKILLVESKSASFASLAKAVNTAASLGAHVISNSYGGGEAGSTGSEAAYDHPGVAVTASSGDGGFGVEFPAASPHTIAVGGTSLVKNTSARGWTETVWDGAGSGCSTTYAKPSWQHDTGCANRTVADVSAIADPNTGVAVFAPTTKKKSAWLVFGGTSVAAPLVGGIYANNGGAVNFAADPYGHTGALNDVTSGNNGTCSPAYLCTGAAGYDGPTGLGTPNGNTAF